MPVSNHKADCFVRETRSAQAGCSLHHQSISGLLVHLAVLYVLAVLFAEKGIFSTSVRRNGRLIEIPPLVTKK
jgi:hypothetical protein